MRGMSRLAVILLAALVPAALPSLAFAEPPTTLVRTIEDDDGDNRLEHVEGEPHVVRQELAPADPARERTRVERLFFAQMTDTHVVDEESPLRVEFLDEVPGLGSAYRAHEGLSAQVLDQMVDQLRNTVSPITQRRLDLVMTTGDNTDNTQLNETRWMIDVMDGAPFVDPDSGDPGPCGPKGYHGVRGGRRYYEPDASDGQDGRGYSPREEENGRPSAIRDFPGLFKQMNERFKPVGFGDLPWYAVFGNHDGLVQGNQPRNPALEALATGCVKVTDLPPATVQAIGDALQQGDGEAAIQALRTALTNPPAGTTTKIVPPDAERRPLRKNEWIAQHFRTSGAPVGHGFDASNLLSGTGNYTLRPAPGVKFVVLDTVAEHGLEEGNLDDDQFRWLDAELQKSDAAHELVMVFAHHSLRTMGQPPVSPFAPPGDTGGNLSPVVHFGDGPRNTNLKLPCKATYTPPIATPVPTPPDQLETVRCLLLRHNSVIAFVNGHEHANRATAITPAGDDVPTESDGFWEINTASHIDWAQQSRVIDLVDNRDSTLSIFGSIVDHAGPPEPGDAPATTSGQGQAGDSPQRLASISRELAFNDPQASHDERGEGGGRGSEADRNVELLIRNPFAAG